LDVIAEIAKTKSNTASNLAKRMHALLK